MVLVLIGMLIVKKTMAASPMLQPILFLCVALELGLVIFVFYKQLFSDGSSGALENAMRKDYAKGAVAGEFLKSKAGGKKLLIVHTAGVKNDKMRTALNNALKETYGSLEIDETKDNSSEGDVIPIVAKDVNEVLARHKDADVIAFMGVFPEDFGQLKPGNPKAVFFLFDSGNADIAKIKKLIESDKVIGVIQPLKGSKVKYSDPVEKKETEAFAKRYILIDKAGLGGAAGYFGN